MKKIKKHVLSLCVLSALITSSDVSGAQNFRVPLGEVGGFRVELEGGIRHHPNPANHINGAHLARAEEERIRTKKIKKLKKQLPANFDAKVYLSLYPDLEKAAKRVEDRKLWAMNHYINHGKKENRSYTFTQFYKDHLPADFDAKVYISLHSDLEKAAKKEKDKERWGVLHYINYGQAEGRGIIIIHDFKFLTVVLIFSVL